MGICASDPVEKFTAYDITYESAEPIQPNPDYFYRGRKIFQNGIVQEGHFIRGRFSWGSIALPGGTYYGTDDPIEKTYCFCEHASHKEVYVITKGYWIKTNNKRKNINLRFFKYGPEWCYNIFFIGTMGYLRGIFVAHQEYNYAKPCIVLNRNKKLITKGIANNVLQFIIQLLNLERYFAEPALSADPPAYSAAPPAYSACHTGRIQYRVKQDNRMSNADFVLLSEIAGVLSNSDEFKE